MDERCPYRKPFAPDFDGCPAYQPSQFIPFDSHHRPLRPVWTCGHLGVGTKPGDPGTHYARCRLGDTAARLQWVRKVQPERLARLRVIQREMAELTQPMLVDLTAAKSRALEEPKSTAAVRRFEELARTFTTACAGFVDTRAHELEECGLPADACQELVAAAMAEWVRSPSVDSRFEVPDEILERFPRDVRALIRPEEAVTR